MIRLVRAFAWLRWRLFVNAFKGGKRRDALERVSRAGSVIVPIVLTLLLVPMMLAFGTLALWAGWRMGSSGASHRVFRLSARLSLGLITAFTVLMPVVRSIQKAGTGLSRFTLLPIPRRLLHLVEVLSEIGDPWILMLLPALLLLPCGFLASGAIGAAAVSLIGGALVLANLLALSSSVGALLQWIYRSRRRGEIATLAAVLAFSLVGLVPLLLTQHERAGTRAQGSRGREKFALVVPIASHPRLFFWTRALPSELYAASVTAAADGQAGAALPLAGLLVLGGTLYGISWSIYRRLLETPEIGPSGSSDRALRVRALRLPLLSPSASAVATAHVRGVLRTVQGKMMIFFSPLLFVVVGVVFARGHSGALPAFLEKGGGAMLLVFGMSISLLSLNKLMLNQFALDGAGLTLQFLAPVSERDLIAGKAAGNGILFVGPAGFYFLFCAIFLPRGQILLWPAALLGGASAYLLLAPVSAILSALFPRSADLSRMGASANPNTVAGLLGLLATGLATAPPVLLVAGAVLLARSAVLALILVAAWAAAAAAASMPLFGMAARSLAARRENLALVAQGR